MSRWLAERATRALERKVSRRGLFTRAAWLGTAMVAAPVDYIMRPLTAYAAICNCVGQSCDCGSLCCDGYTEFCCTITGENTCPPGTTVAGWWKADGSGFCDDGSPQPRYYYDCNASCNGCGCGSNGVCSQSCVDCACECTHKDCNLRKTCCTGFRYGQCNQDIECLGAIVCRVVTCTPPWIWDPACTTTTATDNNTRFHDAPCLHQGDVTDGYVVVGDWNGDGTATPGIFKDGVWYLRQSNTTGTLADIVVEFGSTGDIPIVGDWNGDGRDTVGVFRDGRWLLRNGNSSGGPDLQFTFGSVGDFPVAGDWGGGGRDGIGVVRGSTWRLRDTASGGTPTREFVFGSPFGIPVAGDWNGDGRAGVGRFLDGAWTLANDVDDTGSVLSFGYGSERSIPIAGDWNRSGADTIGVVDRNRWLLRNANSGGGPSHDIQYGIGQLWPHGYLGAHVARVAGANRYATAADVVASLFTGRGGRVYVATGENFPDALAAGAAAGRLGAPILLVRRDVVPSETRTALERLAPDEIVILGGPVAISDSVERALNSLAASVRRFGGRDRYETAAIVSRDAYPGRAPVAFVASGVAFPDALASGPAAARLGGPLLLTAPSALPATTAAELLRLAPSAVYVVGGTTAVEDAVVGQIASLGLDVGRVAGPNRFATAAQVAVLAFPPSTTVSYVVSGRSFADALVGAAAAGLTAAPLLLVDRTSIPSVTRQALGRLALARVVVLGGHTVVDASVEAALSDVVDR